MATLTLTIGALISDTTVTDANAQRVLASAFALFNADPDIFTDQEKLDWIVQTLIPDLLADKARQYEEKQAFADAQANVNNDLPVFE